MGIKEINLILMSLQALIALGEKWLAKLSPVITFSPEIDETFSQIIRKTTTQMYGHQTKHLEWRHKLLQQTHIVFTLHNKVGLYTQSLEVETSRKQNITENGCFECSIFCSILRKPRRTIHFFFEGLSVKFVSS